VIVLVCVLMATWPFRQILRILSSTLCLPGPTVEGAGCAGALTKHFVGVRIKSIHIAYLGHLANQMLS
jgi:hypothetical protein